MIARESREAVVGIDLGTTMSKALLRTPTGEQLALVEASTPWTTTPDGGTETSAERFVELAADLLRRGYARASIGAPLRVSAVAVAGLAESGVLLDGSGRPRTPVVAWFDRRGSKQIDSISLRNNGFGPEFVRRTGLPWDSQASVAKLLWFVDGGLELTPAHRWLSMPEYVVHRLGGQLVREPSLASRTGLLDQATGSPWADGAVELGLPPTLLPTHQPHGESVGTLRHAGLPEGLQGAALLVAGQDHLHRLGMNGFDHGIRLAGRGEVNAPNGGRLSFPKCRLMGIASLHPSYSTAQAALSRQARAAADVEGDPSPAKARRTTCGRPSQRAGWRRGTLVGALGGLCRPHRH